MFIQIMNVEIFGFLLRKVMFTSSLCDARFQRTFDSVPCQIVCAFWKSGGEQSAGFLDAGFSNSLQIDSVHGLTWLTILHREPYARLR